METRPTRLYERDDVVQRLADRIDAARTGPSSVALVTGEAGIGKTSVVRAVQTGVDPAVRVLSGGCDDLLAPPPLQPIRDAVRGSNGPLEQALAVGEAEAVFDAVLAELSGSRLTVLVLDDLHWADDATVDLLRYLVRRLDRVNVVLILSYRDGDIDSRHPLRRLLGALTEVPLQRFPLTALSAEAVRSMAAGTGRDADMLYAVTGGNPFYLSEALAGPAEAVPASVVDAVLARVRGLDPGCVAMIEQLSVIVTPIRVDHVAKLLGEGFAHLDRAEQLGMVEIRGDDVYFRHEIARRAIEQSLPALRRRTLNATIVRMVLECGVGSHLFALIHHAVQSVDVDVLVEYAPIAAREAFRAGSRRQALAHLEAVMPYVQRLPLESRADVVASYAEELSVAHRFRESVQAGGWALAHVARLGDARSFAEALLRQSRRLLMAGDVDAALAAVERADQIAGEIGSAPLEAAAAADRAILMVVVGDTEAGVRALPAAHALAAAAGRTDAVALCLSYLGLASSDLSLLREGLVSALSTGDHEAAARALTNLADVLYRDGRWDELESCLAAGLEFTAERGFRSHAAGLETYRCLLGLGRGHWDAAEEGLRRIVELVDGGSPLSVPATAGLGRLLARRGDPAARSLLVESWEHARRHRCLPGLTHAGVAYAEWAWLNGRRDVAEEIRTELAAGPRPLATPAFAEVVRYLARAGVEVPAAGAGAGVDDRYEQAVELTVSGDVDQVLAALRTLDELSAVPAARLARRRLRTLGVSRVPRGVQTRTRRNPAGLTDRQLDVLRLLIDGLTNAEIAEKLVVSVRTVDHHVSAILTRLGVRTRREAATTARTLNLVRDGQESLIV
ncbi:ATP-binding protein [Jiangella anatolica]|uniref:ATP-binding protein n=1 Tax=Jiangella anatolica TaxID=2670374 RepID=UPI001314E813|nr:LuxR family transcriptional regulator [Jiangella anatolica]